MTKFKPMLAATLTDSCDDNVIMEAMQRLRYPVIVTEKIDGVRALKLNGVLVSRTLKRIPSRHLQFKSQTIPDGFDMEIFSREYTFQQIISGVMAEEGSPTVMGLKFVPLDLFNCPKVYKIRLIEMCSASIYPFNAGVFECLHDFMATTSKELFDLFKRFSEPPYEGICFRLPNSPYKFGRSTLKEQYLVKLAAAIIGEAEIIGFQELETNTNAATSNRLGLIERSSAKSGMIKMNMLGALVVRDIRTNVIFNIGTGFTLEDRKRIWLEKDGTKSMLGKLASYQSKNFGIKDKPRCPSYRGIRECW